MTNEGIQEYFNTKDGKQVKEFIEQDTQEAVVYSVTTDGRLRYIRCFSPVWKYVFFSEHLSELLQEVQRGDHLVLARFRGGTIFGDVTYYIVENKTASQIKQDGTNNILQGFNIEQRENILEISEYLRSHNSK